MHLQLAWHGLVWHGLAWLGWNENNKHTYYYINIDRTEKTKGIAYITKPLNHA